jgi:hypothetical protein
MLAEHATVINLPSIFSRVILTPRGVRSGSPLGNPSTGFPLPPPPFTCRPRTATSPLSANFSAGFCGFELAAAVSLLLDKGLEEEERSGKEEKESKGRDEVGRGLFEGRGLVGEGGRRRLEEVGMEGRGLETIWMGWMRRMVPGVDEMETGEAVTVLPIEQK